MADAQYGLFGGSWLWCIIIIVLFFCLCGGGGFYGCENK